MDDLNVKYAEKCWDVANAIAGFSAVQGIAFSIASQTKEMSNLLQNGNNVTIAIVMIFVFSLAYCAAVRVFLSFQRKLLNAARHSKTSNSLQRVLMTTNLLRMGVIIAFGLLSIAAIWHYRTT
jgi:hypothetical protein